ncbi:hypothetical protein BJX64DRAFT_49432 [Aspergillus heterothallicus]
MRSLITLSLLLLPLLTPLTTSLNLDTKTKYWGYTTSSLANSTSAKCKAAYSAEIACDDFLVGIATANEIRGFLPDMEFDNFTSTCTAECRSSLLEWIANVEDECDQPGDAALKGVGPWRELEFEAVPVATVGRVLEYTLMRACAEDEDGVNCYMSESSSVVTDFRCSSACAAAFWWNQHIYPYSDWEFGTTDGDVGYEFREDGELWEYNKWNHVLVYRPGSYDGVDEGWETIVECGFEDGDVPFGVGIEGVTAAEEVVAFNRNGTDYEEEDREEEGTGAGSVSVSTSGSANVSLSNGASSSSDPEDDGAARIGGAAGMITLAVFVSCFMLL